MKHWNAFCTMFWFATGDKIILDSSAYNIGLLYGWYLRSIDNE